VKDNEKRDSFVVHIKPKKPLAEMTDDEIDGFVDELWGALAEQSKPKKVEKASFGGDRSAAGRYAAEQRWKDHVKREQTLDNGAPMVYDEAVETKAKIPTASGVGRLLTNAKIPKSKYLPSTMVRGYGRVTNGYEIKTMSNGNLAITYHINDFATVSLSDEQIAEKQNQRNATMRQRLDEIQQTLQAKGYQASVKYDEQSVDPTKNLEGTVVVSNPQNNER